MQAELQRQRTVQHKVEAARAPRLRDKGIVGQLRKQGFSDSARGLECALLALHAPMQRHRVVALVVTEFGLIAREDRGLFGRVWERLTNRIVEEAAQQVAHATVAGVCTCALARVRVNLLV